tara:strand:+ start:107 stop:373 length:267 start_codon:yes stop_codon:yes gene_type:complete
MSDKITQYLEERYPDDMSSILLAEGFEDAFMGVVESFGIKPRACYDRDKCIDLLSEAFMTPDEAEEFFQFNVEGAYVGEFTPAFISLI